MVIRVGVGERLGETVVGVLVGVQVGEDVGGDVAFRIVGVLVDPVQAIDRDHGQAVRN